MIWHRLPFFRIGEIGTSPGAVDVVGQIVLVYVGPADRIGLSRATPRNAIEFAGLDCDFNIFPWQRDWHDAELGQEAPAGREGEDAQALQVSNAADRFGGHEIAGVPGTGTKPGNTRNFFIGFVPYFIEPVPVEQGGHIEAVARCEGK